MCYNQQNQSKARRELANFHVYVHLASESFTSTLLGKMRTGPKNSNFPFFKTIFVFIQRLPIIFDFFHFCLDSDYRQFCFSFKKNPIIFDFSPFHFLSIVRTCWNLSQRHYIVLLPITCVKFVKCLNIYIECSSLFQFSRLFLFCPLVFFQGLLIWVILITC